MLLLRTTYMKLSYIFVTSITQIYYDPRIETKTSKEHKKKTKNALFLLLDQLNYAPPTKISIALEDHLSLRTSLLVYYSVGDFFKVACKTFHLPNLIGHFVDFIIIIIIIFTCKQCFS